MKNQGNVTSLKDHKNFRATSSLKKMEISKFLDEELKIQLTFEQCRAGENPHMPLQSADLHPQSCPTTDHVELMHVFIKKNKNKLLCEWAHLPQTLLFKGQLQLL